MRVPAIVTCLLAVAAAAARGDEPATPDWERVTVREAAGTRDVNGAVVVEAADGGLLLEQADQRYELLQPAAIAARKRLPAPAAEQPRDLGRRILAELPAGFDVHVTRHYVICFDTSRDYAKWAGALFERLHEAFVAYWRRAGLDVDDPARPLVVVIHADRRDYEASVTRDVGAGSDRVSGYYSFLTNRVTTYDLTAADGLPRPPGRGPGRLGVEILARPEAEGLVSTLVHEATHQMAFNCGMHRRLAPVPLWVCEGVATCFETPDLRSQTGWRGIGSLNQPRLERFRQSYQGGDLERMVADDARFRAAETAVDAYATAWALSWFLMETRRPAFVKYLAMLAAKTPCTDYGREARLRDFDAAFGPPAELEPAFLRHMRQVERRALSVPAGLPGPDRRR
ncbi:MAG: DUF1570 domain-containing protein [Planctomycetaceae bacterium]